MTLNSEDAPTCFWYKEEWRTVAKPHKCVACNRVRPAGTAMLYVAYCLGDTPRDTWIEQYYMCCYCRGS